MRLEDPYCLEDPYPPVTLATLVLLVALVRPVVRLDLVRPVALVTLVVLVALDYYLVLQSDLWLLLQLM